MTGGRKWLVGVAGLGLLALSFYLGYRYALPVVTGDSGLLLADAGQKPLLLMALIALGTLVSEDLACIGAGLLSGSGLLEFHWAALAAFVGIMAGDTAIFWLGAHFGRPLLRHRWARWIVSERSVDRAQRLFHHYGIWIIFLTRFIPGTRSATYFSAGAVHAPAFRFIGAFALAGLAWTPLLVGLSHTVGKRLIGLYHTYEAFAIPALILAGLILYLLFHYGIPLLTWRGRRRLRGKWMRAVRWEFWPVWQIHWVSFLYVLYLGCIRYRRPMLFTAANPCMPHGGFLGESKADIMERFSSCGEAIPAWTRIPEGPVRQRLDDLREFMAAGQLEFPVVLKPDEGQRGSGVGIIRDAVQMEAWLEEHPEPGILQEFVGGAEFGVFHIRRPGAKQGRIISITIKEQLEVTGNGSDDLDTLIHAHPRAVALLDLFLDRFRDRLETVPREGERIALGELGTHARGALFRDGRELATPALLERMDELAGACGGFCFGRFDIKVPDAECLKRGEGLKVLELNGVTSEATHIYDPGLGLWNGWRTLIAQWKLAFEIAEANAAAGAPVSTVREFVADLFAAWRRQGRRSSN